MIDQSDSARHVNNFAQPDPRMQFVDPAARIELMQSYRLVDSVPDEVRIYFATGVNLFIYAWYVYRFHMVAEQHVLSTLEMALKKRLIIADIPKPPVGLHQLLSRASSLKLIANDRFSKRLQWAHELAKDRYRAAVMVKMASEGISELQLDYSTVSPTDNEVDHDWIGHFIHTIPRIRNEHAHGSDMLLSDCALDFRCRNRPDQSAI